MPFNTLSFADRSTKNLWMPARLEDTRTANAEGRRRADELMAYIAVQNMPFLLGHVITEICRSGSIGGSLETGFFHQVAIYAVGGCNGNLINPPVEVAPARPAHLTLVKG